MLFGVKVIKTFRKDPENGQYLGFSINCTIIKKFLSLAVICRDDGFICDQRFEERERADLLRSFVVS